MIPMQTFLILLGALLFSSMGCSQRIPPHSDAYREQQVALNHLIRNPGTNINVSVPGSTPTLISKKDSPDLITGSQYLSQLELTLKLQGKDASYVYNLMAVEAVQVTENGVKKKIKTGLQSECSQDQKSMVYECAIQMEALSGEVLPLIRHSELKKANPETTLQAIVPDDYLKIFTVNGAPEKSRLSLTVKFGIAETFFLALSNQDEQILAESADFGVGAHRAGAHVNCLKQIFKTDHPEAKANVPFYSCAIHLDGSNGSIDKVDKNNLF